MELRIISLIAILQVVCGVQSLTAQEDRVIYRSSFQSVEITDTDFIFHSVTQFNRTQIRSYERYEIGRRSGVTFVLDPSAQHPPVLVLANGYFAHFYFSENEPFSIETMYTRDRVNNYEYDNIRKAMSYSASSELTETGVAYRAQNLGTARIGEPWIEGEAGPGLGATIDVKWRIWEGGGIGALLVSNGFVSYDRPELYTMNSRVKSLEIRDREQEYAIVVELRDTPDPQVIFLPEVSENMTLTILSVYEGSEWEDTCLNFVFGLELEESRWLHRSMLNDGEPVLGRVE